MNKNLFMCVALLGGLVAMQGTYGNAGTATDASPEARTKVQQFMEGNSVFIENAGQWPDSSIKFALDSRGANVGLTDHGPRFQLFKTVSSPSIPSISSMPPEPSQETAPPPPSEMHEFALVFDGAAKVAPVGRGQSDRKFNYLIGDASNHREGVCSFNAVWYENLYPGISLEMTGRRSGVKYNFHVAPGADWSAIRLRYEDIDGLILKENGALEINIAEGWPPLSDGAPYIYQEVNGEKRTVAGRFTLLDSHIYGFDVTGKYDRTLPLVIDPEVEWSTYLGGTGSDYGRGIAVDLDGACFATGYTNSSGWVSGGGATSLMGGYDGYVVKLNSVGAHEWSTYVGGTASDNLVNIAVDSSGACYVSGTSNSRGYLTKLNSMGQQEWSTESPFGSPERASYIALDINNNCYRTHYSWIFNTFPQRYLAKITKYDSAGTQYLITSQADIYYYGIAVDTSGSIYVVGQYGDYTGLGVCFLTKYSSAGTPQWTIESDLQLRDIAVDGSGACYVTGDVNSDGYLEKYNSDGVFQWSVRLGGTGDESCNAVALDSNGNCYVTGFTSSNGWTNDDWDTILNDGGSASRDAYVVKLNNDGVHLWSSYLGGTGIDCGNGIAVESSGANIWVTGYTTSSGWVVNGWQTTYGGGNVDAFVAKIVESLAPAAPSNPSSKVAELDAITWMWQDNSYDETGFKVYADEGNTAPLTVTYITDPDMESWQQDGLSPNTQYAMQVAATNAYGDSAKTPSHTAWTLAATPNAPLLSNPDFSALDAAIDATDVNPAYTEYALHCTTTDRWVQADGSLGMDAVWQTAAAWGVITVTGLEEGTPYTFAAAARNGDGVPSESGPGATLTTLGNTAPVITLAGDNPLIIECGDIYIEPGASVTDLEDGGTADYPVALPGGAWSLEADPVDTLTPGAYTITYRYADSGAPTGNPLSGTAVRTVNVVDTIPPAILYCSTNPGPLPVDEHCTVVLPDLTEDVIAADTCGAVSITQDPAGGTVISQNTYVTFMVVDDAGNMGFCGILVTVNGCAEGEDEGEGEAPLPHPADLNLDYRIVIAEAIAYLAGWQQGANPLAYAIRAAYLWQNGEDYVYDAGQAPPVCWMLP